MLVTRYGDYDFGELVHTWWPMIVVLVGILSAVAVVGIGCTKIGDRYERTYEELICDAAIALIDEQMPVVAIAPNDHVFEKMVWNIQEAKARGGSVIALAAEHQEGIRDLLDPAQDFLITVPQSHPLITPVLMVVPLQLLSYHIAVRRGCDVAQPRNLAKSVTVE